MLFTFLISVTEESGPDLVIIVAPSHGKLRSFDHICKEFGMDMLYGSFIKNMNNEYVRLRFERAV